MLKPFICKVCGNAYGNDRDRIRCERMPTAALRFKNGNRVRFMRYSVEYPDALPEDNIFAVKYVGLSTEKLIPDLALGRHRRQIMVRCLSVTARERQRFLYEDELEAVS